MIRNWLNLFALGCALFVAACSPGEEDTSEGSDSPTNPFLYEIANADGEIEGWMLGTIHALPDGAKWRTPAIDNVVSAADILMVEVATLDNDATIATTFARLATTTGLPPLAHRVSPDLREPLAQIMARSNIPSHQFLSTESWAAAIMLSQVDATGKPSNGVDRALIRDFAGRPIIGFESAVEQLGIFDRLSEQDQRDLLEGTVSEWVAAQDKPGYLTQAWLEGDTATLTAATSSGIMADPELRLALLTGRNRAWLDELVTQLEGPDLPLVAVGTAHLLGEESLPELLEERGYTVTRMN